MSKAILIIDMPKCCDECSIMCEQYYSAVKNKNFNNNMKPDNCPLREVPKKKSCSQLTQNDMDIYYEQGYNDCIDDILS